MTDKQVPWWTLHEVADELNGTLRHITCVDSNGRKYKRVVIEYEEEKESHKYQFILTVVKSVREHRLF